MRALRILASVMLIIGMAIAAFGEGWSLGADGNLMVTQNAVSNNWAGGETGSASWTSNLTCLAEKQLHQKIHNRNTLELAFGQSYSQKKDSKVWEKPVKSTDIIKLESIFRFTFGLFVDPFAAGKTESFFFDNSDPEMDRYVNPTIFTESFGLAKVFVKADGREWTARVGAGFRQNLNRDVIVDSLTGKRENQISNEGGLEFVNEFTTPLANDKIVLINRVTVFQALFYSGAEEVKGLPNEDYWKAPDVNWENILSGKITEHIMVNLYTQLFYDKEMDLGAQFMQTLSLGLTYSFR